MTARLGGGNASPSAGGVGIVLLPGAVDTAAAGRSVSLVNADVIDSELEMGPASVAASGSASRREIAVNVPVLVHENSSSRTLVTDVRPEGTAVTRRVSSVPFDIEYS